jgi:hypothetical protein
VDPTGRATASDSNLWTTEVSYPGGVPRTTRIRKPPKPGTLVPDGAFARLDMALGHVDGLDSVDLHPAVRGDLLVGLVSAVQGEPRAPQRVMTRLVMLVRAGSKGTNADLAGRSRFVALESGFVRPATNSTLPTLELLGLNVVHDGKGSLRARGGSLFLRHAPDGTRNRTDGTVDLDGTYRVEKDLLYRESAPLGPGALLRRKGLYIATFFGEDRIALGFGLPTRPLDE